MRLKASFVTPSNVGQDTKEEDGITVKVHPLYVRYSKSKQQALWLMLCVILLSIHGSFIYYT